MLYEVITGFITDAAFNAFILIQFVGFFFLAGDRLLGTFYGTQAAAGTRFLIDVIMEKVFADAGRTSYNFV